MPRPANPEVRERLLSSGLDLMRREGFAGVGVKDITDFAGVPKGSFYSYFPSKESLVSQVLAHYWAPIEQTLIPLLLDVEVAPAERIRRFFSALADEHESHDFILGCLIGRMSLEMGGSSDETRSELSRILVRWDAAVASCVREAQSRGTAPTTTPPEELAAVIVEAWEGAALRGKVDRSRAPYIRFESIVLPALLGSV